MNRRDLLIQAAMLPVCRFARAAGHFDLPAIERPRVLKAASGYLAERPVTVTASTSPRSAGGKHDFFSEGDYWWPDPANPDGPYIQRDGMTNSDNFVDHRRTMVRLSVIVPALAAAYKLTNDQKYASHAASHLRAWFIDDATRMNPSLLYGQAIKGRFTGRGTVADAFNNAGTVDAAGTGVGAKKVGEIYRSAGNVRITDRADWSLEALVG